MALPHSVHRRRGDQILFFRPQPEQADIGFEPLDCFTWNSRRDSSLGLVLGHATRLRTAMRMALTAAGVMPRMRPTSPNVAGRAASSRSSISFESPPTAR